MEHDSHRIDATTDGALDSQVEAPLDGGLDDELLIEEISIDGMCGVY